MGEREFNATGVCVPNMHYMVDISNKLEQIKVLVDKGYYFAMNRARQYGKTTTLHALKNAINDEYTMISLTFEGLGDESFANPQSFCHTFMELIQEALEFMNIDESYTTNWFDAKVVSFKQLSKHITKMCRDKKLVLMIDEVDKISNNRVFLEFLSILRKKYLARNQIKDFTFHSVILVGVYDIKNLRWKVKERSDDHSAPVNKINNSPWNIAVDFEVDMSFNPEEISTMLIEYEADYATGMNIPDIAKRIYFYTSGYPFLVSRICQHVHNKLAKDWSEAGVQKAIKIITQQPSTLLDDLYNNIKNNQDLSRLIRRMLLDGERISFNLGITEISLGVMYGYFTKKTEGNISISNKIFEMVLTEYFVDRNKLDNTDTKIPELRDEIISNGRLNMQATLEKFFEYYPEIYNVKTMEFLEKEGRLLFLTYLIPILNSRGFYYIESQTLSETRMDLVINFGGEEFILELKKWRGQVKHEDAYAQLSSYLDARKMDTGYLLTFDFRKRKHPKAEWIRYNDKDIFDVIV